MIGDRCLWSRHHLANNLRDQTFKTAPTAAELSGLVVSRRFHHAGEGPCRIVLGAPGIYVLEPPCSYAFSQGDASDTSPTTCFCRSSFGVQFSQ